MKAAGKLALSGTPGDVVEFLNVGQFTARNRDQEHASIEELTEQAERAGLRAEEATEAAQKASARAVAASQLAKEAAKKAARETEASRKDSARAAVKAQQAANAARAAADAAPAGDRCGQRRPAFGSHRRPRRRADRECGQCGRGGRDPGVQRLDGRGP
ncbi:hypothetical protein GCM10020221_15580 [Streptomyces thioluteus]|uniref:Uncharacterized protein n=1 Tax=Streptomyces thioluteus TaxID=66431 RepID=A0ABP6J3W9_STRTU